ncbi:MAG: hypothetical protein KHW58_02945 [Propionibacterium sp.]|nr:hypothetical protein [Propionibacterium sp.]MDU5299353.1 hypothetical protein [Cutibacterium avidum]MDU5868238.1 hypothetical protein [Cutibacterium avidum]
MKILLVVDALQPGNGTTASTLRFSHALRDQGHEVRLLSVESTPVPSTRGIPVVSVPVLYLPLITHLARRSRAPSQGHCLLSGGRG